MGSGLLWLSPSATDKDVQPFTPHSEQPGSHLPPRRAGGRVGGHLKRPGQPVMEEAGFCDGGRCLPVAHGRTCLIHEAGHLTLAFICICFGLITELTALAMCLELSL